MVPIAPSHLDPLVIFRVAIVRWVHVVSFRLDASTYCGPFVERQRHDARRRRLSANADFDFRSDGARFRRNIGHADIFLQKRRGPPLVTRPASWPPIRQDSRRGRCVYRASRSRRVYAAARIASAARAASLPRKRAFSSLQIQPSPASQRRGGVVNFMAVEAHARFQSQSVPRAQAAGNHAGALPASHQIVPEFFGISGAK